MKRLKFTSILQATVALGALAGADLAQAQPVISGITPDGSVLFQASDKLAFTATAPAGITNVSVQLNGKKLGGTAFLKVLSTGNGLTVNGQTVSAPLSANVIYSATIVATDANGTATTSTVNFDTITPAYTFEVEDYDYNSGHYFDNPQTNAYRGLAAVDGVDAHNASGGNQDYRPHDATSGGLGTEGCGDKTRIQYTTGQTDYDVGWNNNGNWANYTRRFPAGSYNLYIRASNPGSDQTDNAEISGPISGRFGIPATGGWQNYTFTPLTDTDGNKVEFDCNGTAQTLTLTTTGGNYNANFFLLMPVEAPSTTSDAVIDNLYPNGAYQFQATNKLSFTVTSTLGVSVSDIAVQLGATNLTGTGTNYLLVPGNGLTTSGSSTSWTVTAPLASNTLYTAFVQATDANGVMASTNFVFDTIIPSYTWEAEDWDYAGGQYFPDWTPDCYSGTDGYENIDFAHPSTGGGNAYGRTGLSTESAADIPRQAFDGFQDYDIGNNGAGNWVNYTRDWPAGVYNIYIRVANGNSGTTTRAGVLSLVSSGAGTDTQTVAEIGSYNSPYSGGWQKYDWQPVRDAGGNLVRLTGGAVKTLRHTVAGGNANQGFYMLMPADLGIHTLPYVSAATPDGSKMFNYTNLFHFTANSAAGIPTNKIVVTLDGVVLPRLAINGSLNTWNVSFPVTPNACHTVKIELTDDYGSTTSSYSFATFSQDTAFFFEAEDYDYNGGQFVDNAAVNAYQGAEAVTNVDASSVVGNFDGTHVAYRPSGLNQENASDVFTVPGHDGYQNYDLGNSAAGNWANYTRTWPAGVYNIYMRAANGNTGASSGGTMDVVVSGFGTTSQTTQNLGSFDSVPATGGWQTYTWVALRDSSGKLAEFTGGSQKTLRATCGGGQNDDYYVLVPKDDGTPVLSGLYPDGAALFEVTNKLSFTVASPSGISTNDVLVTLNGVALTNLVFTGSATSWTVSYTGLKKDSVYAATISFVSQSGGVAYKAFSFDTFSPTYYTFEAEDYDYGSGKYFDNPQTNAYSGLAAVDGTDAHNASNGNQDYRPHDAKAGGLATEVTSDVKRPAYTTGQSDYDVGWNDGGNWANYTRHFPAGTYNIYVRAANPNAAGTDSAEISGPVNGRFAVPNTGGWQIFTYIPLTDANGDLVEFTPTTDAQTLKLSTVGGSYNANFYMLVPAASKPKLSASLAGSSVKLEFATQSGYTYQVVYKTSLTDTTWTALGSAVTGNGSVQSVTDAMGNNAYRFYRLQATVKP